MFCRSLFVLWYFIFWPLCCLFFDIWILIAPLVSSNSSYQGQIQDFKLGEAHFKKLRRAEGGSKILGVFRVKKKHDFTPKNDIFSNFRGPTGSAPAYGREVKRSRR
jgi:hypothetical protein